MKANPAPSEMEQILHDLDHLDEVEPASDQGPDAASDSPAPYPPSGRGPPGSWATGGDRPPREPEGSFPRYEAVSVNRGFKVALGAILAVLVFVLILSIGHLYPVLFPAAGYP